MNRIRRNSINWCKIVMIAFVLFFAIPGGIALAEQDVDQGMGLDEAINLALQNSEAVKKAEKEIDRTKELRNYAGSQLEFIPIGHIGNPGIEMAYSNAVASELTYQMSRKSFTVEEDIIVLDTCKKYWEILKMQEKIEKCKMAVEASRKQLQNSRIAEQVGISLVPSLSPGQLILSCQAQYLAAQADFEAAGNDLEKAYRSLNQAIGLGSNEKPVLRDTITYQVYDLIDVDHAVNRALTQSPAIWQAEQVVNMKQLLKDMVVYSGAGQYQPSEARRLEVEQAQLDVGSAKNIMREAVGTIYYQIRNMEELHAVAVEGVKVAEENLHIKQVMYEAGMATIAEVEVEKQKLADAQYNKVELEYTHSYLKLACEKPWAAQLGAL